MTFQAQLQLASALQTHRVTNAEGFKFSVLTTFGLVDEVVLSRKEIPGLAERATSLADKKE